MADFDVEALDSDFITPLPSTRWTDPAASEDPTRLNPRGHVQHRYQRIIVAPGFSQAVEFRAIVGGVPAPADAALGGRLFSWSFGVIPTAAPMPSITSPISGKTSRAQVTFAGFYPGHYVIVCARPGGGHIGYPFDVEQP